VALGRTLAFKLHCVMGFFVRDPGGPLVKPLPDGLMVFQPR
jgi:hypothetical protein